MARRAYGTYVRVCGSRQVHSVKQLNMQGGPTLQSQSAVNPPTRDSVWIDRHSPYDRTNARAAAEDELLALSPDTPTTVLDLCGLWGGPRAVKNFVGRMAPTKEALRAKVCVQQFNSFGSWMTYAPTDKCAYDAWRGCRASYPSRARSLRAGGWTAVDAH